MLPRSLLQTADPVMDGSMSQDLKAIASAWHDLGVHMYATVGSFGVSTVLSWVALIAAVYLFLIDRTNWRTNILTALLVPYILLNIPAFLLGYIRSEVGYWVAFILVVLRLFFPKHFPDHAEIPGALILLLVVTPNTLLDFRFSVWGEVVSLAIGLYLLYEHIHAAGGVRKAFVEHGVPVTIGIISLFIAPLCQLFL